MKARIVVLGAGGFIGRHLVAALATSGRAVPVATARRALSGLPAGVEQLRVDATDAADLQRALDGADGVVNCVTGSGDTIARGAALLFKAAVETRTRPRIVHLSTMSAYGSATGAVDEQAPLLGDLGPYSAGKAAAERLAAHGGNFVILRPGIVYGPGSPAWSERIAQLLVARRLGDLGMAGDGICNLVHVDDLVQATLAALHLPGIEGEAFNLSLSEPPSWNEYFVRYACALGAVPVRRLPARRLRFEKLLAVPLRVAEIASAKLRLRHLSLPPPIPPSQLRLYCQEIRLLSSKAEQMLGMRWKPLDDGLRETAAWYRAHVMSTVR